MLMDHENSVASANSDGGEDQPFTLSEKDIMIKDMYVDVPENLQSAQQIAQEAKEGLFAV